MSSYAFLNKEFVPLEDAKVGIMTHALLTARRYSKASGATGTRKRNRFMIFRLKEHYERLRKAVPS
jgi:branched-chain amino acid aminotransferase